MKDGKFENQKEIYEALIAGKKIKQIGWNHTLYVCFQNGTLMDNYGVLYHPSYISPCEWSIYEEPKKTKKYIKRLVRYGQSVREEYLLERTPNMDIIKSYDDYILIDEDGNLVEETNG